MNVVSVSKEEIATSPLSILGNDNDSGRRFAMTLHRMFLFLHNMAGEDTDQGEKSQYEQHYFIPPRTPLAIMNKSRVVIARKPWMKMLLIWKEHQKGFRGNLPMLRLLRSC
jgi:hypothetical protein